MLITHVIVLDKILLCIKKLMYMCMHACTQRGEKKSPSNQWRGEGEGEEGGGEFFELKSLLIEQ